MQKNERIKLGVSACLLGRKVRYDGQHTWDRRLTETLGRWVELVPVCPEAECGLGVPREAMRLVGDPERPRLMTINTNVDLTRRLQSWAERRVRELESEDLCGFIFKSRSPSSGMARVKVYNERGGFSRNGVGMFARAFMAHFPLLPVEEDGRLHDPKLRENFIERVFCLKRWRELLERGRRRGALLAFHAEHKLLILSHSPRHYRELSRLAARGKDLPGDELFALYEEQFMAALALKATPAKHANVLTHIMGRFKKQLSAGEKEELLEIIGLHRTGVLPLIVPVTLLNHYVRKYDNGCLKRQYYLHPHPVELQLRNHV